MAHYSSSKSILNQIEKKDCVDKRSPEVDGAWGWVVVISTFLIHVVVDGIINTFGLIETEIKEEMKEKKGTTSWVCSIMSGMVLCIGPVGSILIGKYGCRAVTIVGAIVASTCLFISYWAQNVFTLIITIGFGVGCGLGLIYLPAIVSVTAYFDKYRSIATGIAVCGTGVGQLTMSHLIHFLIENYKWRNTLMILAGIVLCCVILGIAFRPLSTSVRRQSEAYYKYQRDGSYDLEFQRNGHYKSDNRYKSTQPLFNNSRCEFGNHLNQAIGVKREWRSEGPDSALYREVPYNLSIASKYGSMRREFQGTQSSEFSTFASEQITELKNSFNFNILKDPIFILFALSNFFTNIGFYVQNFSLPDYSDKVLNIKDGGHRLLMISGIIMTLSRIFWGFASGGTASTRLWIFIISIVVSGVATGLFAICMSFSALAVCSTVVTFTLSSYVTLRSVIIIDLLGMQNMENAFGLLLLAEGLATFIGSPIVGTLYDRSHSYTPGFLFSGVVVAFSGIMLVAMPMLQRSIERNQIRRENDQSEIIIAS